MLRIGVDVEVVVDVRHDGVNDEVRERAAALVGQILRFDVGFILVVVDLAQIGNQLVPSVDAVVVDRDDDRLVVALRHHALDVFADVPAFKVVVHTLVHARRQNALTVEHIDDGILFRRLCVIVRGRPDIDVLVVAVELKDLRLKLRVVLWLLALHIGEKYIVNKIPAADEAVERHIQAVVSVIGDVHPVIEVHVRFTAEYDAVAVLSVLFHFDFRRFSALRVQERRGHLRVFFGRPEIQGVKLRFLGLCRLCFGCL